jgi:hypothetical protein
MASLSSRSSLGYAEGLQPFCTQIVLAVHLRLAALWQSLIMSMCHMRTDPRLPATANRRGMNRYRSPRVNILVDILLGLAQPMLQFAVPRL